jgi:fumarylacetoacetase
MEANLELNDTHDPALKSWVMSANAPGCDFPIQNLPFAVFRRRDSAEAFRGGVAIGDSIVDLDVVARAELVSPEAQAAALSAGGNTLNAFMAMGPAAWSALRLELSRALRIGTSARTEIWRTAFVTQPEAEYQLPARVGDYTDFYTSIYHATAVGRMFRPDNALLPNYHWVPIGYHGRTSSLGISGMSFRRPLGQTLTSGAKVPVFGPSQRLDYELELGVYIGKGNSLGEPIAMSKADDHFFGMCLLNDWSARDLQAWEYQPLGPFLAKNFATTLSPWIVTAEALAPFRMAWERAIDQPQPLPYLDSDRNRKHGALDIQLQVFIETAQMRASGTAPSSLSCTSFRHAHWSVTQLIAHHSVNGCNLQPGDVLGTGTQSGPTPREAGSLLELTQGGTQPVALANGESRRFLEDGDVIIFRAWCEKPSAVRIGFGEVRGQVIPALDPRRLEA